MSYCDHYICIIISSNFKECWSYESQMKYTSSGCLELVIGKVRTVNMVNNQNIFVIVTFC